MRTANGDRRSAWSIVLRAALAVFLVLLAALAWLRWDAGQPREQWFSKRHGQMESATVESIDAGGNQQASAVSIASNSGLAVDARVIRDATTEGPLPVLVVLGGHRTGSAAVELFGDVGNRAVVALDYPYAGPQRVRGVSETLRAMPLIRKAFLDTPPAISLVVDWLQEQPWVDASRIVMVGASLGVPFAATAAARDERLSGLLLVHGAADNRLWLQENLSRRFDLHFLQPAVATLLHWFVYGPVFETEEHVAAVSPRPVLIVGAREDERTPAGQTEVLYEAAREPKMLRWTEGQHLGPERNDIIEALLRIADEELPFFDQGVSGTSAGPAGS
ncbi:MAG TPA: prolyl oligopeptidase family serine peptidase [Woeseiaceae bacterium]|nr:prolyl oligopeptidase family serine peptidase [Woeseiaceae bacterium]